MTGATDPPHPHRRSSHLYIIYGTREAEAPPRGWFTGRYIDRENRGKILPIRYLFACKKMRTLHSDWLVYPQSFAIEYAPLLLIPSAR